MGNDSASNKLHKCIAEQNKSTRAYCLQQAKKLKKKMEKEICSLMKKRAVLLEDAVKMEAARPLTISEAEKSAIIVLEKDLYDEKEVQKAVDYLRSNPDSLEKLGALSDSDVFKIGMIVKSSSGTASEAPKDKKTDEKEKIRAELLEARKTVPHRTALALTMKTLYSRAKKAGILDEVFPKRERRKMGELHKIAEMLNDREKLRKVVKERGIRTVVDFMCRLEDGADVYQHSKEIRKLLSSVLKEVKSTHETKKEKVKCSEPGPASRILTLEEVVKGTLTVLDCCTEENLRIATGFVKNSGNYDLSSQEGIQKIENMVLEFIGKKSEKKPAPGKTVPLHDVMEQIKNSGDVEPFNEKGFTIGGAYIKAIMKREGLDESAVKGYIYSIIHGFKLGTAKAAIGTNYFPERYIFSNIQHSKNDNLNGNAKKPSKVVDFLVKKQIAYKPMNAKKISLENKIENIDINWRPLMRVLFEQHKKIISR